MTDLKSIVQALQLTVVTGLEQLDRPVTGVYISDLLSDVMGKSQSGQLWLTIQGHTNVVAVAVLKDLQGIILTGGNEFDAGAIQKAKDEEIILLKSTLSTYAVACALFQQGLLPE